MQSFEEKVKRYKQLAKQIEELEAERKQLGREILIGMPIGVKDLRVAEYIVKRYSRLFIKTPLLEARKFGAVKMEEVVDKEKIKKLYALGQPIPDVTESQYVMISLVSPPT